MTKAPLIPCRAIRGRNRRAFTLVEVLVAMAILMAGIVAIVQLFPMSLEATNEAALKSAAVVLAQEKVEELRRDADQAEEPIAAIDALNGAETVPVVWPLDERLSYSYSDTSPFGAGSDLDQPCPCPSEDMPRVIVRLSEAFNPSRRVLFELCFEAGTTP